MRKNYLFLILLMISASFGWGQEKADHFTESFENPSDTWSSYTTGTVGFDSGDWDFVSVYPESSSNSYDGDKACRINDDISGASITSPSVNSVGTVSFYYHRPFSGSGTFSLQKSVGGGAFVELTTQNFDAVTTPTLFSYDVNDASNDIKIRIVNDDNTAHLTIDYVTITDYSGGSTPTITLSETTLTGFTYEEGNGPSAEQSYTVSGSNLTNDINLTPPTNYEISTGTGGSFSATNPITLTQSGGDVASTTIYVRLKSGLAIGSYNNEDISIASTGAISQTVTCSGSVTGPTPDIIIVRNCDPQNNYTADRFAEIYNASSSTVDLTGWSLENVQGGSVEFTWSLSGNILPGEVLICGNDDNTGQTITPDFTAVWSGNSWNGKGGDGTILKDNTSTIVDYAVQDDGSGTFVNAEMKRKLSVTSPLSVYNSNEWVFTSVGDANDVVPGFYGTVWVGGGTNWSTDGNWDCETPASNTDVTISSAPADLPNISGITAECDDLTIQNGAELTVATDGNLTINGDFTNGSGTLTIKSDATGDGSVIVEGNMGGPMEIERYIPAYSGINDGWHLLSSPRTASFDLATSDFVPTSGDDDVFNWNEVSYLWEDYFGAANPGFDFEPGYGYLVAYKTAPTPVREFSGYMNNQDFSIGSLTNTDNNPDDAFDGWHLLGNPYTSALKWNDGNWSLSGINATAKIYNEGGGNYIDVAPNGYIPMNQGFFVQVLAAPGSLTIPLASREHNTTGWYKSDVNMQELNLKVSGGSNSFYDYASVKFDAMATEGFDSDFDSYKMYGMASAPQIMTVLNTNEEASTNVLPFSNDERIVPLNFKAGTNGQFTINVEENTVMAEGNIYLEDQLTDQMINLSTQNSYTFEASTDDDANRFLLHFNGVTGVEDVANQNNIQVYSVDDMIYINSLEDLSADILVYNINGQLVYNGQMNGESLKRVSLGTSSGVYLVNIVSEETSSTHKVYVK